MCLVFRINAIIGRHRLVVNGLIGPNGDLVPGHVMVAPLTKLVSASTRFVAAQMAEESVTKSVICR